MKLTIDNREIIVKKGMTILNAVEQNDIYIPHLCSHPELTPYGGCRLCIVEVEDIRGYPTACTTFVTDGMVIRTETKTLKEMRQDILRLILSEHPTGCIFCEDEEKCADFQTTIRKVGLTTGCRWCAKDKDCELRKVVDHLQVEDISLPLSYRGLPVERYDPFFDRDYNLCIYCSRCVRICQEHRKSSIISFKQRGKLTTIGPAFDLTHIEADCEFCGACVSVCPTGAMSEKSRKWWGVPDEYIPSVCPLCSFNCDIQFLMKDNKIIGTIPLGDPHTNGGELCVKGRFCLSELVNHPDRILAPRYKFAECVGIITWDEAFKKAGELLKNIERNRTAVYLSPNLTAEEMAAANLFAHEVLNTDIITSSVLNHNLSTILSLSRKSVDLKELEKSEAIISVFLNGNYNYAPLTLALKRAVESGASYYQIGWLRDTTSRFATKRIIPEPGKEKELFSSILEHLKQKTDNSGEIRDILQTLRNSKLTTVVVGTEILNHCDAVSIVESIEKLIDLTGARVFVVNPYGNLYSLLSLEGIKTVEEVKKLVEDGKISTLYMIGDCPFDERPAADFIIYQGVFPLPSKIEADLILPMPIQGEISGSYMDLQGNRKSFKAVAKIPDSILDTDEIFAGITLIAEKKDIKFTKKEISKLVSSVSKWQILKTEPELARSADCPSADSSFIYTLIQERNPYKYHNSSLNRLIKGMEMILPEDTLIVNPADAEKLGLHNGDSLFVDSDSNSLYFPVVIKKMISSGYVYLLTSTSALPFVSNPCPVKLRRNDV
jgi:NADH dehydrogenase/NADH:ubiquinone oxidoreductase subunit G